jgi:hypothetical protein
MKFQMIYNLYYMFNSYLYEGSGVNLEESTAFGITLIIFGSRLALKHLFLFEILLQIFSACMRYTNSMV